MALIRQVIQVEILRQDRPLPEDLATIADDITFGDSSGSVTTVSAEEVSGPRMAELLVAQGSDPAFLGLADDGSPLSD